jgi:hypothetical protein
MNFLIKKILDILMNTGILPIISNFAYFFIATLLILENKYIYGFFGLLMWFISHMYHLDTCNHFWGKTDMIFAFISFLYILIKCHNELLCIQNIILLILLLTVFSIGYYCFYKNHKTIYNIVHSMWHICSALFILYLVNQNEK